MSLILTTAAGTATYWSSLARAWPSETAIRARATPSRWTRQRPRRRAQRRREQHDVQRRPGYVVEQPSNMRALSADCWTGLPTGPDIGMPNSLRAIFVFLDNALA